MFVMQDEWAIAKIKGERWGGERRAFERLRNQVSAGEVADDRSDSEMEGDIEAAAGR
jgi:hypothetical protein